jgi:hypothetical protein
MSRHIDWRIIADALIEGTQLLPTNRLFICPTVSLARSKAHSLGVSGCNCRKRVCGQLVGRHLNKSVAIKKKSPVMTECEVRFVGVGSHAPSTKPSQNAIRSCAANIAMARCKRSKNPATEPEPTSNTCKDTPAAGSRLARSAESNRSIPSR